VKVIAGLIGFLLFAGLSNAVAQNKPVKRVTADSTRQDTVKTDSLRQNVIKQDTVKTDTLRHGLSRQDTLRADSLRGGLARQDSLRKKPVKQIHIVVFRYKKTIGFDQVLDDSTRRWMVWTIPSEWAEEQPGAITYRMGAMGFHDAVNWQGHSDQQQKLYVDGLNIGNAVTGNVNSQLVPQYMLNYEDQDNYGLYHVTRFKTQDFYMRRPLTRADYEKAGFGYRVLDVLLTRNITRSWNIATYYWVRSDDGAYLNEKYRGRQAFGRVTHYLSHQYVVKGEILYNGLQRDQPGGYVIQNMNTFNFDRLNARSKWGGSQYSGNISKSSARNTIADVSIEARRDTLHPVSSRLEVFYNTYRRFFDGKTDSATINGQYQVFPADTSYYRTNQLGAFLEHQTDIKGLHVFGRGEIGYFAVPPPGNLTLRRTKWSQIDLQGRIRLPLSNFFSLTGTANTTIRSDAHRAAHYSTRVTFKPFKSLMLQGALSGGTIPPTIQQLYWTGKYYHGYDHLKTSRVRRYEGEFRFEPDSAFTLGLRGYRERWKHGIRLDETGNFVNTGAYSVQGGTGWIRWVTKKWEADLSTTYQQYQDLGNTSYTQWLANSGIRLWNRFSLFRKGYLFNWATYVKGGISFLYSPFSYDTPHYYPELDMWNYRTTTQRIPPFYRLNAELSARVRMLMVYFKVENVLDGLNQLGYFETADYPMPPRRIFFGIRAIIRD